MSAAPASHRESKRAHDRQADDLLQHLDGVRRNDGLLPLTKTRELTSVAQSWSNHMADDHTLAHNPDLTTEVKGWEVIGENVGQGPSVDGIDEAFDASSDHYANETNPAYTEVGIGVQRSATAYLWVTVDLEQPE